MNDIEILFIAILLLGAAILIFYIIHEQFSLNRMKQAVSEHDNITAFIRQVRDIKAGKYNIADIEDMIQLWAENWEGKIPYELFNICFENQIFLYELCKKLKAREYKNIMPGF